MPTTMSSNTFLDLPDRDKDDIHAIRKKNFPEKLLVSYSNVSPLWIVKGENQYLIDENGIKYLDTRNNVPHVGHTHPEVVRAVCDQVNVLNITPKYNGVIRTTFGYLQR